MELPALTIHRIGDPTKALQKLPYKLLCVCTHMRYFAKISTPYLVVCGRPAGRCETDDSSNPSKLNWHTAKRFMMKLKLMRLTNVFFLLSVENVNKSCS